MAKEKVTIRKYEGDDSLSWAVFVEGQQEPVVSGLAENLAKWYKKQIEKGTLSWQRHG